MSTTITTPLRGQHAIDLDGRDLGIVTKRVSTYLYLEDGSRVQLHRLRPTTPPPAEPKRVQPGVTLYEFPDGTCAAVSLDYWLALED